MELFNNMDSTTVNEFYIYSPYKMNSDFKKDYTIPSFNLNPSGKYVKLLEKLASNNDFYKSYLEAVKATGDISPSCIAAVLKQTDKIDLNNKDERLVFIVTILGRQ